MFNKLKMKREIRDLWKNRSPIDTDQYLMRKEVEIISRYSTIADANKERLFCVIGKVIFVPLGGIFRIAKYIFSLLAKVGAVAFFIGLYLGWKRWSGGESFVVFEVIAPCLFPFIACVCEMLLDKMIDLIDDFVEEYC